MAYSAVQARSQMLEDIAAAADELEFAVACLSEAYEALDDDAADELEQRIFRPVQASLGRLKRAHAAFASRHGLPERAFAARSGGVHTADPKVYVERAVESSADAEQRIAELQDSMLPVDVGDPELRAGLSATRAALADVPGEGRRLLRSLGR